MSREEVHGLLGAPNSSWSMRSGNIAESWPEVVIRYEKVTQCIIEIEFTSSAQVEYQGIKLFEDPEAFRKIVELDGAALQGTGTVVLPRLGISTGDDLGDPTSSDRTVCLFKRGLWELAIGRLTPYTPKQGKRGQGG
jgi:hypothetical protein